MAVNLSRCYVHSWNLHHPSSTQDRDVIGIWKELRVLASKTSIEASNEVGVNNSTNGADGINKDKGDNETEGTEAQVDKWKENKLIQ